jgi:hypothetical protein
VEKHYPTHEKETLAIVHALKKWRHHLIGGPFQLYTDHKTLQFFDTQKDLSRRQARWAEYLAQFDYDLHYVRGKDNVVADGLSRLPIAEQPEETPEESEELEGILAAVVAMTWETEEDELMPLTTITKIEPDESIVKRIREGYDEDPWCLRLKQTKEETLGVREQDGILFVGN